ncbi:MAG: TRAP transporter substrate-binding protein [Burkholderiaceae bacterium]
MLTRRNLLATGAVFGCGLCDRAARAQTAKAAYRFKVGTDLPETHSVNVRLREAMAAIATETQGRVAMQLFPNNQLGSDSDMMTQVRSGALEMATFPGTVMSTLVPVTAITGVGFAFSDYDKVWAAMDGAVGNHVRDAIAKANLVPFQAVWDNGFRQITTSTKPIRTPEDLKNFKIRVPVVPLWVQMFRSLEAAPVSMPLSEAYLALQTRIADGQENPLALIEAAKFFEVQKYASLTNHAWDGFWFVASGKVWKGVPDDVKATVVKHIDAAARKQRDDITRANVDLQKALEGKGMTFNKVDTAAFRNALQNAGFYREAKNRFDKEAWALLTRYTGDIG